MYFQTASQFVGLVFPSEMPVLMMVSLILYVLHNYLQLEYPLKTRALNKIILNGEVTNLMKICFHQNDSTF